jgi:5-formyltetrahydrofolate cyclo-ligase
MASKQQLREQLKAARDALAVHHRDAQSVQACTRALPELLAMRSVAVYSAISSELSASSLVTELRKSGIPVAFPRVQSTTRLLEFCLVDSPADLRSGTLGILEPVPGLAVLPLQSIDAFLVPALGFDPQGQRLGWGQGHYDHTLAQCPHATRVGICFQEQIVASLPCEPTDERMDIVITDTKRYQGEPRSSRRPPREPE